MIALDVKYFSGKKGLEYQNTHFASIDLHFATF